MTLRYASSTNTFLPQATGHVIGFIRKPEEFKLNEYVSYMESKTSVGLYWKIGRDVMVRADNLDNDVWSDGDVRPSGEDGTKVPFEALEFRTIRRDEPWQLGYMALDQAATGFDLKAVYAASAASRMMTKRARRAWTALETESNWTAVGHTATASELSGIAGSDAFWKNASSDRLSPSYNAIWKTCNESVRQILRDTNGGVKFGDLCLVISPDLALEMAQSDEISNYVREQAGSEKILRDGFNGYNDLWGLPDRYRGLKIVVEDSMYVSEKPLASGVESTSRLYVKSSSSAHILARPGKLDGVPGSRNFSTFHIYHYGGLLKVTAFNDQRNERLDGHVTENVAHVVAAPVSGYYIQGCR